ncbi:MAG: hypothetical protein RL303_865 [Verrucomicrobiota bacterium]|jgi:hypothetical protein
MTAFFRGLILFLFGVLSGAAGMLFFTPSFNVVVTRGKTPVRLIELPRAPAGESPVAELVAAGSPSVPKPVANADTDEPAAPATAVEPALDFEAISRHLIVWPTAVSTKSATIVEVLTDGDKPQPLALEAGTVLQLSKVRADGMLEVRAKGAKFVIQSSLTDFAAEVTKRAAELAAKGAPTDAPQANAGTPTMVTPTPSTAPVAPTAPAAPATLDDRVNTLFGKKRSGSPANEAKPKEAEKKKDPFAR